METLRIGVYRRQDDMLLPAPANFGESPLAWDLHHRRARALHAILGEDAAGWRVVDWGNTDDETRTHEVVDVQMVLDAASALTTAVSADDQLRDFFFGVLGGLLTDGAKDAVKVVFRRLWKAMRHHEIAFFNIEAQSKAPTEPPGETAQAGAGSADAVGSGLAVTVDRRVFVTVGPDAMDGEGSITVTTSEGIAVVATWNGDSATAPTVVSC